MSDALNFLELALSDFLLAREVARCSPRTLEHYRYTAGSFIVWLADQGVTTFDIRPAHIRMYLATVKNRGVKDNTLHAHARGIKAFTRFLVQQELMALDPFTRVDMPRLDRRMMPTLSTEEVNRLITACKKVRDKAIIFFLLDTGLRASELLSLRIRDIDMRTGEVRVTLGKGGKDRIVVIGYRTRRALVAYYKERGAPQLQEPIWPLKASGLRGLLRRLGQRAGVKNCSPHTFRRTFATACLRNKMDVFTLRQLMGHASIAMLQRYLILSSEDLQRSHRIASPVDNMVRL